MPRVQIKDVPEATHRVLRERAARAHQSLQEYLRSPLIADAAQPTLDEVFDRIAAHRGGRVSFKAAVDHFRAERDRRRCERIGCSAGRRRHRRRPRARTVSRRHAGRSRTRRP
ncbi:FitA-like ribbon-helix-helix domain-containing protein [Candidatus Mycobacterium methanotrophicum]|uniref:FitA-like ribbon-helix-helix domain-containing protein n=1 Tax=Candidatus Mycobacterium methanotrophicum TaxID=2943498 RepID=UPI00358DBCF7